MKNKCLVFDEDNDGNTPLHLAARQGWKHAVRLLLERKANIDARYKYSWSAACTDAMMIWLSRNVGNGPGDKDITTVMKY